MDSDDLLFDIDYALRFKIAPGIRWTDDGQSRRAAEAILRHLELCGYRFTKKPPAPWHSTPS